MPRKKVVANPEVTTATVDLDEDEQFVKEVTTTTKIGREKRKPDEEPVTDPPEKIIDVDDHGEPIETDEDDPVFEPGTLGSLLNQSEDDELRNTRCNVKVTRKADTPGESFAKPSLARLTLEPLRNVELTTPQADIEEIVRRTYFGGHYYLQMQIGQNFGPGWDCDLADPTNVHALIRAQEQGSGPAIDGIPVIPTPAPAASAGGDFIDDMIARGEKMKALKGVLFGDELDELRRYREKEAEVVAAPETPEMYLLKEALKSQNPTLQDKLLDRALPPDPDGNKSVTRDIIDAFVEHKDTILPIVTGLIGALFGGGPQPALPPNAGGGLDAHASPAPAPQTMQQPVPLATSRFRRDPAVENAAPPETIEPHPATTEPAVIDAAE